MSEEKTQEVINLLKVLVEQTKPKNQESGSSKPVEHQHWKAEDISDTCPECIAEKEKIGKAYVKKMAEASKNLEYECLGCGTHFGKKEKACPDCGKTEVRAI